ncbi:hypothetical protein TTHERM_00924310 (macronuclear) [Tetrahymena thermophila SB210]|uniref:Uncharacterized protein n=1 Tax=Tetrahymena thermophila (strain SB210) TaxID=312017 RepID=Q23WL3_TETTS|nr:hypothetical protein TTHERM_00924310 [Tetrahymena thermophila SB210]EAS00967.2 hypothetical protein TTHERM_00924310 [Tetrahymena thermophila SB210]|eukprot:XP_001021212.2 hypothetical protein TTHERM_00924310 [Tetrahymena thermophila SB210]
MGQEISSPIKCAGDDNIKHEQYLEKIDPSGEQKLMHMYKYASTPQNSTQKSILTFNPDEQSVQEKVDQKIFQVPISFRKEEDSIDKINESPVKSSKQYFTHEELEEEEKVKKTSPVQANKQYSQTAKNSPISKSPLTSVANKQLNQSPLSKMLEDLEVKRKRHQEIQNMGYPKGFSPTKLEMIQELMAPKYQQEDNQRSTAQRKRTPEQSDQFVSKLLQKGEEIKLKHQALQEQQLNKEFSECTFQPTLEKSSNLYNSGIFNSRTLQSQASNANLQRSIQDQSNYQYTSSIQQPDLQQQNYFSQPHQQQNRPQIIQDHLKSSFGNNQINQQAQKQQQQYQQYVEKLQQTYFQQPQPHEQQQQKIEKQLQFKMPETQSFQQPYQNQQSANNLSRNVPYSLQNSPQNNKSTVENSQVSNYRDSTPKTKKSSISKLSQISKQKLTSPQSVTWQKDISPRSTLSNQYSYRTPNSVKSPSSSQQIQKNQSNLRKIIQESNNSPRINQKLFHKKDENQSQNEGSSFMQNAINKSNNFNQNLPAATDNNSHAKYDNFELNNFKVNQDKNVLKQANQNFISNHVPNINNNLTSYQVPDKFNYQAKSNAQSKTPIHMKNQDFINYSKSQQTSPKNYSFQDQLHDNQNQLPKQSQVDFTYPINLSSYNNNSNNISQFAQAKATPTSNLLLVPTNTSQNNLSKNPAQLSNDDSNHWRQKELFYPQIDDYQYKQTKNSKILEQSYASLNPNNNSLTARSRSWKQFLDDQNKFSDVKELNIQHSRVNIESTTTADFVYKPEISKKSKQINSSKLSGDSDVFKRLNNLVTESVKKKYGLENEKTPEKSRGNSTNRIHRSPEQQDQLYNRLYEDASVRKEKNKQLSDEVFTSITASTKPSIAAQRMNDYCLAQKFVKDFEEELSHVVNSESVPHSYSLNYNQVQDLTKRLRFISDKSYIDSFNYAKERALLNDLWIIMNGQINNGVRSRNLLLFFFAVHGINIDLPIITSEMLNNSVYIQNVSAQKINIQISDIKPADKLSPDCEQYLNTFGTGNPQIKSQVIPSFHNISSDQKPIQNQKNNSSIQSTLNKIETPFNPVSNSALTPRNSNSLQNNQVEQSQQETSTFIPPNACKNMQIGTFDPIQNWSISPSDVKMIQNQFKLWYLNRLHQTKNKDQLSSNNQEQPFSPRNGVNGQSQILHKSQSFISPYKNKNTEQLATNHRQRMIQIANVEEIPLQSNLSNADIQNARRLAQIKINEKIKQEKEQQQLNQCTFHPETVSSRSPFRDNQNKSVYEQLYDQRKKELKRDKSKQEVEYEKECDECTFNPQINTNYNSNIKRNQSQQMQQPYVRNADLAIKRMKQAQEEHQFKEKYKSRGYEFPKRPASLLPNNNSNNVSKSPRPSHNQKNKSIQINPKQGQNPIEKNKSKNVNLPSEYSTINFQSNGQGDSIQQLYNNNNGTDMDYNQMQNYEKPIMLYVDVNLGENQMQRIVVREGDKPEQLTDEFIKYYQLPQEIKPKLVELLAQQINSYLCQVDEDRRESEF